ncbi:MAG: BolA/IbaG family iron-sulfur metabolism protein [Zetaproteobacteria bacterium]|nr:BolA/IbaG family iron-sulfur metabolism protein [Zetaproteobacteria bacterium]
MTADELTAKLLESFPEAQIKTQDLTGGGDHWRVEITAKEFQGLTTVEQHQAVYKALGELMREAIHALSLQTTPLES